MTVDLATLGLRVDSSQARRAANDLDSLTAAGGRAERGVGGIETAMARMSRQMGQVLGPLRAVQSLFGVAFAGAIVQQVIALADSYHVLEGRLRLVTRSEAEMGAVHQRLFALSQQTRTAHEATVDLYSRMARASKELGLDQNALVAITKATNQALAISGATAQSAAAAVFQFAQALASGELRGDEFRSMMESAPRLMQAVAEGMGAPVGKLRELAETGRLTAEVVTQALLKQAGQIDAEFSKLPVTVGQAWTNVGNAILKTIGEVDTAIGGTGAIASVLMALADNFDKVAGAAAMAGATIAASFVAHGLAAMIAAVAAAVAALRAWVVGLLGAAQAEAANTAAIATTTAALAAKTQAELAATQAQHAGIAWATQRAAAELRLAEAQFATATATTGSALEATRLAAARADLAAWDGRLTASEVALATATRASAVAQAENAAATAAAAGAARAASPAMVALSVTTQGLRGAMSALTPIVGKPRLLKTKYEEASS